MFRVMEGTDLKYMYIDTNAHTLSENYSDVSHSLPQVRVTEYCIIIMISI